MRIGILGGSFDPVHNGHIALARSALKELKLDRLYFVPAKISPMKLRCPTSAPLHRMKMLRSVLKKMPRCKISTLELGRTGASYTFQTLLQFQKKYPDAELFFVMGDDCLRAFKRWRSWKKILGVCTLAVGKRSGGRNRCVPGKEIEGKICRLKSKMPPVSSTRIRSLMAEGKSHVRGMPAIAAHYAREKALYGGS